MRLKLAGALVHKGSCWVVSWRAWDFAHCACAGRPRLKRYPLGRTRGAISPKYDARTVTCSKRRLVSLSGS
jgi:hypothetical protein